MPTLRLALLWPNFVITFCKQSDFGRSGLRALGARSLRTSPKTGLWRGVRRRTAI
jgi:hypothetical protein